MSATRCYCWELQLRHFPSVRPSRKQLDDLRASLKFKTHGSATSSAPLRHGWSWPSWTTALNQQWHHHVYRPSCWPFPEPQPEAVGRPIQGTLASPTTPGSPQKMLWTTRPDRTALKGQWLRPIIAIRRGCSCSFSSLTQEECGRGKNTGTNYAAPTSKVVIDLPMVDKLDCPFRDQQFNIGHTTR